MIRNIFKYTIVLNDKIELEIPEGAEILTVQSQFGNPQLWALVDPEAPIQKRYFRLAGTGHPMHYGMGTEYKYINTFQMSGGRLVFHLFEMTGV